MNNYDFWVREGMNHIIPPGFGQYPEGWDVKELIRSLSQELGYQSVIDYGCGDGRLCESFDKDKYLGLDINHEVLAKAKEQYAGYNFAPATNDTRFADIYLAYTVFLHMNDDELHENLRRVRCKHLIVAEILGREWRRDGTPPVYNRELSEYVRILRSHDLVLQKHVERPYERYAATPWYQDKNTNISFLVFRKCHRNPLI